MDRAPPHPPPEALNNVAALADESCQRFEIAKEIPEALAIRQASVKHVVVPFH
jgi:hypothetical protein